MLPFLSFKSLLIFRFQMENTSPLLLLLLLEKCDPIPSSVNLNVGRNADSQAPSQTCGIAEANSSTYLFKTHECAQSLTNQYHSAVVVPK